MTSEPLPITIKGTGSYAPEKVLTNDDISKLVDTSDEWILSRSGIKERRIAAKNETCSDMAAKAGLAAMKAANLSPEDIDLVIVATITPDKPFPSTACLTQHKLGLPNAVCFDIEAACSGFLFALETGVALVRSGNYRHALIIGSEKMSSIIDWTDRTTCVLFGDSAGAVIIGEGSIPGTGFLGANLSSDGASSDILHVPGGGSLIPPSADSVASGQHFLKMKGREVFKFAVRSMEQSAIDILKQYNFTTKQIDVVIPHQANLRIIELLSSKLELPMEKFFINLDRYGNTSSASIPLALDEAVQAKKIKSNDLILMLAFGGGLTWGSALIRWP
ncbi:MAG: ketoacyl-ACP synthase III [Opitutaceae bacterium]|nr:ketoacyl-ACP synthase III [Opitutaceae bacterium]